MQTDIIPITNSNILLMSDLLYERNRTVRQYITWKYNSRDDNRFRGLLVKTGSTAVGCFGIIPKQLQLHTGEILESGWFADWYVVPAARGHGIGELLLNELSSRLPIVFGHPGPQAAQKICRKNGYQEIGFHARRRILLRPWSYSLKRRRLLNGFRHGIIRRVRAAFASDAISQDDLTQPASEQDLQQEAGPSVYFRQSQEYAAWILSQPVGSAYQREYGEWDDSKLKIKYFDERVQNGEQKRSVLFISGNEILDAGQWRGFVEDSRAARRDYIEIFTTDQALDMLLSQMGAWLIQEAPILVTGMDVRTKIQVQAWDRENWTFLADG